MSNVKVLILKIMSVKCTRSEDLQSKDQNPKGCHEPKQWPRWGSNPSPQGEEPCALPVELPGRTLHIPIQLLMHDDMMGIQLLMHDDMMGIQNIRTFDFGAHMPKEAGRQSLLAWLSRPQKKGEGRVCSLG
jgi:hypothetical protein